MKRFFHLPRTDFFSANVVVVWIWIGTIIGFYLLITYETVIHFHTFVLPKILGEPLVAMTALGITIFTVGMLLWRNRHKETQLGRAIRGNIDVLAKTLQREEPLSVHVAAVESLSKYNDKRIAAILTQVIRQDEPQLQHAAAAALLWNVARKDALTEKTLIDTLTKRPKQFERMVDTIARFPAGRASNTTAQFHMALEHVSVRTTSKLLSMTEEVLHKLVTDQR